MGTREYAVGIAIALCDADTTDEKEEHELTIVPTYLKKSLKTLLLGNEEYSNLRILFFKDDRSPEVKYLNFTLDEFLSRFNILSGDLSSTSKRKSSITNQVSGVAEGELVMTKKARMSEKTPKRILRGESEMVVGTDSST